MSRVSVVVFLIEGCWEDFRCERAISDPTSLPFFHLLADTVMSIQSNDIELLVANARQVCCIDC